MDKAFPVLWDYTTPRSERVPLTVPWEWIEKFEHRLQRNHGQSVRRLAERGGLGASEMWAAAHDAGLWDDAVPTEPEAVAWLRGAPWNDKATNSPSDRNVTP